MRWGLMLAVAIALAPATACSGKPAGATSAAGLAVVPLTVTTSSGKTHRFKVEVARTEEQQERGLMFRKKVGPNEGMIFPMSPPRVASFWMKNTVVPLDIIFVRVDGTIATIASETVPYSLDPVGSGEPVAAVLELAGGRAAELGIAQDDKVVWTPAP